MVNVISKRLQKGEGSSNMYYVNDGVYGCFNTVLYDHYVPTPALLNVSTRSTLLLSLNLLYSSTNLHLPYAELVAV